MPSITSNLTTFTNVENSQMIPSGDGQYSWGWSNPSNAQTDNNAFASFGYVGGNPRPTTAEGFSDTLDCRQLVTQVPSGATINGIEVVLKCYNFYYDTFYVTDAYVHLLKNGATIVNPTPNTIYEWMNVETTRTYGGPTDTWGTTWTASDINGSGFGVSLACEIQLLTGGEPPFTPSENRVDQVYVNVYYTGGSSGSAATILPHSINLIGVPRNITVKSVTGLQIGRIVTPPVPSPTIKPVINARLSGLRPIQISSLTNVKSVTGIRVTGLKTIDLTRPTIASAIGIRLSSIRSFDIANVLTKSVTAILPSSVNVDLPKNNTRILSSTNILPTNFTNFFIGSQQIAASTKVFPSSISSNFNSTNRIVTNTSINPSSIKEIRSISSANILSAIIASGVNAGNNSLIGSIRLNNRFYDIFKTDGTLNFGDTTDFVYNSTDGNYNRTSTAGTKVVAYQCIFDKGDDFYVQGLVKTDNGYTTSGLSGIGFGIQPSNKNYGYFAVVDVRNGLGGSTTHSLQLRKIDASGTTILASYNTTGLIKVDSWYRIYAYWTSGNGISVYFNERDGTPIGAVLTSNDTTFSSGYDGFTTFSNSSFDNLTNIPRQYVDVTDGGIKPFFGLGLPSLTVGTSAIRPSSITIDNIGSVRIASKHILYPRVVPDINKFGTVTIARGTALVIPSSINITRNVGTFTIIGGFGIQPIGLGVLRFGTLTMSSGRVSILPGSIDYNKTINVNIKANININPGLLSLSKILGNIQLSGLTNLRPSGIKSLELGNINLQFGISGIRPNGLDFNRIGNIALNSKISINPRNFTNIVPPIGIILKVNANVIPRSFTFAQIGNQAILTSVLIRPSSFTRIVSPSLSVGGLINLLPGTINAGAIGNITFRASTKILPSGLRIFNVSGVSSIGIISDIMPSGIPTRNIGSFVIRSAVNIIANGILSNFPITNILINRREFIIPNKFNNTFVGIVNLKINSFIVPSGLNLLRIGTPSLIARNTNIILSGIYNPVFGNLDILGDNNIKPIGLRIPNFGQITIGAGPRIIYPSTINLLSAVKANIDVNSNILPTRIQNFNISSPIISGLTEIIPSSISGLQKISLSLTSRISILPNGFNSFVNSGIIRITGNTNIIPRNFTQLQGLINTQIESSTLILPPSIVDLARVSGLLRLTGRTLIIPSGLPMPSISNQTRILSSGAILPSSITFRLSPINISIKSSNVLSSISAGNISNFGNIRLNNRFYDIFSIDGTLNFGDTVDFTFNSVDGNYNRSTTAGTKVVAYQCIFDRGTDFYAQGLVKSDTGFTTSSLAGIGFGIQPSNKNYGYFAIVDVRNGTGGNTTHSLQLRKVDATGTTVLASYNATGLIKTETWYRIYAYWTAGNGISVYFNERDGTQIGTVLTSNDTTFTSGYDGFTSFSNASFDNLTNIPRQYLNVTDGGINYQLVPGTPSLVRGSSGIRPSSITISNIGNVTIAGRNIITPSSVGNLTRLGTFIVQPGLTVLRPNSIFLPRNLGFINIIGGGSIQPIGIQIQRLGSVTILAGPRVITPSGINLARLGNISLKVNTNIIPDSVRINKYDLGSITIISRTLILPSGLPILGIGTVTLSKGAVTIQPSGILLPRIARVTILSSAVITPGNFTNIVPPIGIIIKSVTKIIPSSLRTDQNIGLIRILSSAIINPRNFTNIQGPRNITISALTIIRPGSVTLGSTTNIGLITLLTGQSPIRPFSISTNSGLTGIRILSFTNIIPSSINKYDVPGVILIRALTAIRPESVNSLAAIGQITILSSTIINPRILPNVGIGNHRLLGGTRAIQPGSIDITQPPINIVIKANTAIRPGSIRGYAGPHNITLLSYKNIIPGSINLPNNIGSVLIKANINILPGSITITHPSFGSVRINSSIIIYPNTIRLSRYELGLLTLAKRALIQPEGIPLPPSPSNIIIASKTIIYPTSIYAFQTMRMFPYFAYNPLAGIPNFIYVYGLNETSIPYSANVGDVRIAAETKILPSSIQNQTRTHLGSVSIKAVTTIQPGSVNQYEVSSTHTIRAGTILIRPASVVIKPEIGSVSIISAAIIRPSTITLGNTNNIGQVRFNASTNILPSGISVYELPILHLIKPGPIVIRPYTIVYNDEVARVTIKAVNTIRVESIPDQHRIGEIVIKSVTAIIPKTIAFIRIGRHKILMSTTPGNIYSYFEMVETIEDDIELVEMEQILEEFDSSIESDIR